MTRHDDEHSWSRPVRPPGHHDQPPMFDLSDDERMRFEQLTAAAWSNAGRPAVVRRWVWAAVAAIGGVVMFAALGRLPTAVAFGGFIVTMIGVAEFSRLSVGSPWWDRFKEKLGLTPAP